MSKSQVFNRGAWVGLGVIVGLVAASLHHVPPVGATATSQQDTVIICTAGVDGDGEALFTLDCLKGDLRAWVPGPQGGLTGFGINVMQDFGIAPGTNPKFTMVSGAHQFRNVGPNTMFANTIVYVAESTTGKVVMYGMPWNRAWRTRPQGDGLPLAKLGEKDFRAVLVRQ